jgi:transcriptional regulator with XRE-family HTH domain
MKQSPNTVSTIDSSIKRARLANHLTLRQLANRLNVTPGAVQQWEQREARGTIKLETLRRALRAIGSTGDTKPAPFERREDRVTYELHRAIAKKLIDNPDVVRSVMPTNINKMRSRLHSPLAQRWLDEWQALEAAPVGQLIDTMLGTDNEAKELRQNSPFTGVLTQEERLEAIRKASV